MRKKLVLIIALLFSIALFFIFKPSASPNQTVFVSRETVTDTIVQSGNVNAVQESTIYSPSTGVVQAVMVINGEKVVEGQELVKIISTSTDKDRAAAYASYTAALSAAKSSDQSKIANQYLLETARKGVLDAVSAEKTLNDNLGASKNNSATGKAYTQEEIDSVRSTVTSARQNFAAAEKRYLDTDTGIQSSRAAVNAALLSYNATKDTALKAPIDGTIANLNVNIGDNTTASSVQATGTKIANLINLDSYRMNIKVTELQISKLQPNMPLRITLDAFPTDIYQGHIDKLDTLGTEEQGLVIYNVEIAFNSPNEKIKPGMSATVELDVGQKPNALVVPVSALKTDGEKKFVTALQNNKEVDVPVKVGMRGSKYIEILEGPPEGTPLLVDTKN